ncbi:hypothetical protein, partial [Atlantibacter hermannii]|uniref:hypothetical protein n=1 Tax=Atlantibacter hermannii TaxID=565 RepID=UPI00296E66BA
SNITTNGIRTVHWDIVRHGNICGGEPVMGKAIKSVWKYRGQSMKISLMMMLLLKLFSAKHMSFCLPQSGLY